MVTTYTYNTANQLIGVSMPRHLSTGGNYTQTRSFQRSGSDLVSSTNPENGTVTYQYDGAHHVTLRTDAMAQQTKYTFDSYGRLGQVQHYVTVSPYGYPQLQAVPKQDVTYYYDYPQMTGAQNTWGRLAAVTFNGLNYDGTAPMSYVYSYNQAGVAVDDTL
jgi:YD repeat-containing protein